MTSKAAVFQARELSQNKAGRRVMGRLPTDFELEAPSAQPQVTRKSQQAKQPAAKHWQATARKIANPVKGC